MSTGSSVCLAGSRFTEQVITDAFRPARAGIQVREARPGMGVMPGSRVRETEREPPDGGLEDLNLGRGKACISNSITEHIRPGRFSRCEVLFPRTPRPVNCVIQYTPCTGRATRDPVSRESCRPCGSLGLTNAFLQAA